MAVRKPKDPIFIVVDSHEEGETHEIGNEASLPRLITSMKEHTDCEDNDIVVYEVVARYSIQMTGIELIDKVKYPTQM